MRNCIGLVAIVALVGCSDPLSDVPRLSDTQLDGPEPVAEVAAAPDETEEDVGFFQRLLRPRDVGAVDGDDDEPVASDDETDTVASEDAASADVASDDAETAPRAQKQGGFWDRLFGPERAETVASERGGDAAGPAVSEYRGRGGQARPGLFSNNKAARRTGADAREVAPGEVLPFGDVARACHVGRGDLGHEVGQYPEKRPKYRLYDSNPGHPGLNSFYITGFADGCPRQITAALAVFGAPSMYEALRYGLPESARTGRETDRAYERVKSRVCGVSRNKPCGNRIGRMDRGTVFVSVYNRFEGADGWMNILIHDGVIQAMAPGG